ncbi:MAG: hypothetical protein II238_03780 [Alphaproteobacteria bacterium]|nr:hypothetical protein [Alphaproteobacteria bacterium]
MNRFKKFLIVFLSFLPSSASAVATWLIGLGVGVATIAGISIYRSITTLDTNGALDFFSSCWSCQMFSDVLATMSELLPPVYKAIGYSVVPVALGLTAIWFAWTLLSNFTNSKFDEPWNIATTFSNHMFKLGFVSILLLAPLPRMITDVAIEPIFNVGLSLNRMVAHNNDNEFGKCVVTSTVADLATINTTNNPLAQSEDGAFSPKLRHNLTCELAGIHQITGLGMTVGWLMLNMAFDHDYMFDILWVPIVPNIILLLAGAMIMGLFLMALVPIPLYLLEVFIKLSMDLIMLPLMLLAWLFKGWKISLAGVGTSLKSIIDNVVSATLGIAITGIFVSFATMFLNAVFGTKLTELVDKLNSNDSEFLMNALMMENDTLITVILMGIFIAMFMTMIPALIKTLFNVQISTEFYDKAKKDLDTLWEGGKKWYKSIKK